MEIVRPQSLSDFLERRESFLARHEAEHGLMLGVARATRDPAPDAYYVLIIENGAVVGAALRMDTRLILSREEVPHVMAFVAKDAASPMLQRVLGPTESVSQFTSACGSLWKPVMSQGIYECRAVTRVPDVPGSSRIARLGDRDQLAMFLRGLSAEALNEPVSEDEALRRVSSHIERAETCIWEVDSEVVSVAAAVAPTLHGIRINNVYTPPKHRGCGYASALVASLTHEMLTSGRQFTFLHTDLENPTSNAIYLRIGYRQVGDFRVVELLDRGNP